MVSLCRFALVSLGALIGDVEATEVCGAGDGVAAHAHGWLTKMTLRKRYGGTLILVITGSPGGTRVATREPARIQHKGQNGSRGIPNKSITSN